MDHKDLANTEITQERKEEITRGVQEVLEHIQSAADACNRKSEEITLLAATKTRDVAEILAAIDAGIRCYGENRPQEIVAKSAGLREGLAERGLEIPSHMIGQLQSNKISKIVDSVTTIESVDSVKLAERIARRLGEDTVMGVYLEVNESGEETKSGCNPQEALEIAQKINGIPQLRLEGLMTIGMHSSEESLVRKGFAHLRLLRDELQSQGIESCVELSMGMSSDLGWAIAEGSTVVRVGTGIFGERAFI